jgi:hypothetical protein
MCLLLPPIWMPRLLSSLGRCVSYSLPYGWAGVHSSRDWEDVPGDPIAPAARSDVVGAHPHRARLRHEASGNLTSRVPATDRAPRRGVAHVVRTQGREVRLVLPGPRLGERVVAANLDQNGALRGEARSMHTDHPSPTRGGNAWVGPSMGSWGRLSCEGQARKRYEGDDSCQPAMTEETFHSSDPFARDCLRGRPSPSVGSLRRSDGHANMVW